VLALFMTLTVPLMPVQALLLKASPKAARRFPHWYHRQVCRVLGIKLTINGAIVRDRPVLLVSNHTSWLDIPVLSAVAPVSFVAKKEVGSWPFVSALARLQRSVFVDRARRQAAGETAGEITERLKTGDAIVLFAEGTSSDGNRVLPFKTSLFAAVKPSRTNGGAGQGLSASRVEMFQAPWFRRSPSSTRICMACRLDGRTGRASAGTATWRCSRTRGPCWAPGRWPSRSTFRRLFP
jgi:1-acyl-sn-glycerol-3-phosphate acyltransferase